MEDTGSDSYFIILFILGIIALVVIIFYIQSIIEKNRREALKIVADRLRMTFKERTIGFDTHYPQFKLFIKGHSRKAYNIFEGAAGDTKLQIFDYDYTVGHGKNSSIYRQTVVMFSTSRLSLPSFAMEPEGFSHKLKELFSSKDIDFNDYPEFSKNYYLTGENEMKVIEAFNQKVLDYFSHVKGISVEGYGQDLIVYRANKRAEPETIEATLKNSIDIANLFIG